jgi:hypothetical protein
MFNKEMMERAIKKSAIKFQINLCIKHITQTAGILQMRASNIYVRKLIAEVLIWSCWVSLTILRIKQN